MKTILVYYSNNGSNRYLTEKIADRINCEIDFCILLWKRF